MSEFKSVHVVKGSNGWGGPFLLKPDNQKKYVVSVTGGGIHPVAQKIADLTGATAVDSFKNPVDKEEMLCVIIDCGGTARCGTYPRFGIPTINVKVLSPSGPLAKFMTEDVFVSGVTVNDITVAGEANSTDSHTQEEQTQDTSEFQAVKVEKGSNGWGGPFLLKPDNQKKYVVSVTGGGIHPVAQKIADLTGVTAVDSFKNPVDTAEMLCVIIDCGGTARCGTYPKLGIPTINVKVLSPSGPLAKFMTEDVFVSGVTVENISTSNKETVATEPVFKMDTSNQPKTKAQAKAEVAAMNANAADTQKMNPFMKLIDSVGRGAGHFMNVMYQAGRDTIETVLKNILPFMAFVATLIGIINYTGIGDILAHVLTPLAGSVVGLIFLGLIGGLPFLSPLIAPGGVIGSVIGVLIGNQIASGTIPPSFALPALFAINAQVGCDFAPVGLTLGEAKAETITVGVPAILFSRVITGPLAVLIAYGFSFFL